MQKVRVHISGMHCASCVGRIEKILRSQEGVQEALVNLATEEARMVFDDTKTNMTILSQKIEPMGYQLHSIDHVPVQKGHAVGHDHGSTSEAEMFVLQKKVMISIPLVLFAAGLMFWDIFSEKFGLLPVMSFTMKEFFHHLLPIIATYILFVTGSQYLRGLWMFLRKGVADMDTLVGLGTVAAFLYSFIVTAFEELLAPYLDISVTYYDVTIIVIGLITLGKYFEARAKQKTGSALRKLLGLQVKTALVLRDGKEMELAIDQVQKGDIVLIKSGMKIPVDGIITEGSSFVDESLMTGEPVPVGKGVGDRVSAGTMNTTGAFSLRATGVGAETLLAHIIELVQEAQGSKAPIQRLADKISGIFVPIVLIIAVLSLLGWLVIGGSYLPPSQAVAYGLVSFVSVLVIACPCALGLATPTAIMVGVGRGATHGILIKNAEILEKLYKVNTLVVDKTGTLTEGKPRVLSVATLKDMSEYDALALLAGLEAQSEHPLATAILVYAEAQGIEKRRVTAYENLLGQGVRGVIDGITYYTGGPSLLTSLHLAIPGKAHEQKNATIIYLATEKEILFSVAVGDQIRDGAKEAIEKLHALGIRVVMATGDNKDAASAVAQALGIDDFFAQVLPQDKLIKIKELQEQGSVVAMAGDGVNDAPALAQADVSIAMATGSDVAIEASAVTLLGGDITKIVAAIELSRVTMKTVKQNLFWAFVYNLVGIPLATGLFFPFFGWLLSPIFAGFAMAMSSVSVVLNSLRLKMKKL